MQGMREEQKEKCTVCKAWRKSGSRSSLQWKKIKYLCRLYSKNNSLWWKL